MALKIIGAWLVFCACSCWFASAEGPVPEPIREECTSGFMPLDRLTALSYTIITRHRQQRIIPDINFTCNGVITKWIVGARWDGSEWWWWDGNDWYPDLQLWRETGNRTYTKVGNTTLRVGNESTSGVYEYPVDPPLEFQAGDILGIFQPHEDDSRVLVNYERDNGPSNYLMVTDRQVEPTLEEFAITAPETRILNDAPLIAVETSNPQCECGFVSKERILFQKQRELTSWFQQRIIPHINFTCDGNITKWIMGTYRDINRDYFPELQIWRDSGNDTYTKVGNTPPGNATFVQTSNTRRIYEYIPDHPLEFQAGDVLGVFQPSYTLSDFFVVYEENNGPPNYFIPFGTAVSEPPFETFTLTQSGVQTAFDLPLVTVEIVASPTTTPQDAGSSENSAAVAAGATIAVLFVIGLGIAVIVVVVGVVFRLKSKKYAPNTSTTTTRNNLDNPVYEGEIYLESSHDARYVASPTNPIPTSKERVNQIPQSGTTPDGRYELVALPSSSSAPRHLFDNPLYADTEPIVMHSTEMMDSGSNAQMEGVYVPTVEQRKTLSKSSSLVPSENLYVYSSIRQETSQLGAVQTFFEESEIYWVPSSNSAELYAQMAKCRYREIFRHQISITERLGSGQFGRVDKGVWVSPRGAVEVAVKMLKKEASEKDRIKFLQEAAINGQFHHPNVVQLHGVITVAEPMMIVLEFMPKGDLRGFLNRQSPGEMVPGDMPKLCLQFCHQVASGMAHLSGKSFVHRDLAARNVLVSEDNVCKIADFGMARDLEDEDYYVSHGGQVPVKWTAPEALKFKKYSTASDVWSYGAVMYEIWSLGHKPFEGYTNQQVMRLVGEGYRLPPPPGCPKAMYSLMIKCWHPEKSSRPTFHHLLQSLSLPDTQLLRLSERDTRVHPRAAVLGAPLEAGKSLYPDLQGTYMS